MAKKQKETLNDEIKNKKSIWLSILESSGGTAIISFLLAGLIGQCINFAIQEGIQEREFQKEWMKTHGDQALLSYKEYLDKENAFIQKTYEIIGTCFSSSAELIAINHDNFNPKHYSYDDLKNINEQKLEIIKDYTKSSTTLNSESAKLRLMIGFYHPKDEKLFETWSDVQKSLEDYMKCAGSVFQSYILKRQYFKNNKSFCKKEEEVLISNIAKLTKNLESSRKYLWEGWESPNNLRKALERP